MLVPDRELSSLTELLSGPRQLCSPPVSAAYPCTAFPVSAAEGSLRGWPPSCPSRGFPMDGDALGHWAPEDSTG